MYITGIYCFYRNPHLHTSIYLHKSSSTEVVVVIVVLLKEEISNSRTKKLIKE